MNGENVCHIRKRSPYINMLVIKTILTNILVPYAAGNSRL